MCFNLQLIIISSTLSQNAAFSHVMTHFFSTWDNITVRSEKAHRNLLHTHTLTHI